jgi:predicted dehydrogenase
MNGKILKTAVIGLGRIGWQVHIPEILKHKGFKLCAVVDPLSERLEEAKEVFQVNGVYESTDDLFKNEKLDLVVIASPTIFHCEQALQAFENGCDVFCDKPVAVSLKEADLMISAMKNAGRKLMVYQPHRSRDYAVALRGVLAEDLIGSIYMVKRSVADFDRRNDWQAFKANGGGMLNNSGSHYIDQLLYLTASRTKDVFCKMFKIASVGDAEDVVKVVITTDNDITLDIDINMACAQPVQPWFICGERGTIVYDAQRRGWLVKYYKVEELEMLEARTSLAAKGRKYGSGERIPWREAFFADSDFDHLDFFDEVYKYFALSSEPFVPIEQTREVMRTLLLCRESSEESQVKK